MLVSMTGEGDRSSDEVCSFSNFTDVMPLNEGTESVVRLPGISVGGNPVDLGSDIIACGIVDAEADDSVAGL